MTTEEAAIEILKEEGLNPVREDGFVSARYNLLNPEAGVAYYFKHNMLIIDAQIHIWTTNFDEGTTYDLEDPEVFNKIRKAIKLSLCCCLEK